MGAYASVDNEGRDFAFDVAVDVIGCEGDEDAIRVREWDQEKGPYMSIEQAETLVWMLGKAIADARRRKLARYANWPTGWRTAVVEETDPVDGWRTYRIVV